MDVSGNIPMWERPGTAPWVTDPIKRMQYDGFIFATLDRLGRNARHISHMRDWAEDYGKRLIVREMNLQWPPAEGDLASPIMWDLLSRLAEYELKAITKRIKETREWLEANEFLVGSYPYGYTTTKAKHSKTLVPDEAQAKVVEQIFDMKIEGKSLAAIAEHLTAEGEYTPNDLMDIAKDRREVSKPSPWAKSTVNRILRNPIYKGQRIYGKKRNVLRVEPIIDPDVWRKVQVLLTQKSVNGGRPRTGLKPLLLGVIKCGACGGRMYRVYCGKDRIPYYRCHGLNEHVKGCGVMVRIADADAYAAEQVAGWFDEPYLKPEITPRQLHEDEIKAVEREYRSLDLDDPELDAKQAELRAERQRLINLDKEAPPEYVDYVPTGKTKGEEWADRNQEGQREFLLEYGCEIQVLVSKTRGANGRERNFPLFSIAWRNYPADLPKTA